MPDQPAVNAEPADALSALPTTRPVAPLEAQVNGDLRSRRPGPPIVPVVSARIGYGWSHPARSRDSRPLGRDRKPQPPQFGSQAGGPRNLSVRPGVRLLRQGSLGNEAGATFKIIGVRHAPSDPPGIPEIDLRHRSLIQSFGPFRRFPRRIQKSTDRHGSRLDELGGGHSLGPGSL